jgi:(S)-ureidoglycine aminohydrolase
MRLPDQLVHSRARVRGRYALMPLEGFPASRMPNWPDAEVRVLAAPALGAGFVQYIIDLPAGKKGGFAADSRLETFHYVLAGTGQFRGTAGKKQDLTLGCFGLTAPGGASEFVGVEALRLLVVRKVYQPAIGVEPCKDIVGHESHVSREVWENNPHSLLQTLIPDEFPFDMAMNIFSFDPGFGLPVVETHVMEHGLYFLRGKGVYYLGEDWMEVQKDDFIWMGPYCTQSFYATGSEPAQYIYYKNVNREIAL